MAGSYCTNKYGFDPSGTPPKGDTEPATRPDPDSIHGIPRPAPMVKQTRFARGQPTNSPA